MSYFQTIFIHEGNTDELYIRKLKTSKRHNTTTNCPPTG